jgi:hypothetical protein
MFSSSRALILGLFWSEAKLETVLKEDERFC